MSNKQVGKAGRSPQEFAPASGISRAGLYNVPREHWPKFIRYGRRVIIIEAPEDWLARMAELGGIPSKTARAA